MAGTRMAGLDQQFASDLTLFENGGQARSSGEGQGAGGIPIYRRLTGKSAVHPQFTRIHPLCIDAGSSLRESPNCAKVQSIAQVRWSRAVRGQWRAVVNIAPSTGP